MNSLVGLRTSTSNTSSVGMVGNVLKMSVREGGGEFLYPGSIAVQKITSHQQQQLRRHHHHLQQQQHEHSLYLNRVSTTDSNNNTHNETVTNVTTSTTTEFQTPSTCKKTSTSVSGSAGTTTTTRKSGEKYSLRPRSIQNRIESEKRRQQSRKDPKPKQKPPPLSKYRRRTANARERSRMQEINQAFEVLRQAVPQIPVQRTSEKVTKITTLRLAMNYIEALTDILKEDPSRPSCSFPQIMSAQHSALLLGHCNIPSTNVVSCPSYTFHSSSTPSPSASSTISSTSFSSSASTALFASPNSASCCPRDTLLAAPSALGDLLSDDGSTLGDPMDSLDDLIGVGDSLDYLLESDGESLQFNSDLSDEPTP